MSINSPSDKCFRSLTALNSTPSNLTTPGEIYSILDPSGIESILIALPSLVPSFRPADEAEADADTF
jgi:hypothetical protein